METTSDDPGQWGIMKLDGVEILACIVVHDRPAPAPCARPRHLGRYPGRVTLTIRLPAYPERIDVSEKP